jgi:antitoxin (DNA-binding transcriptional repressor) of toxin-antitoxin stability system
MVEAKKRLGDGAAEHEVSATEASTRFAPMLDGVEHRGETFIVVRRGRAIATIAPAHRTTLGELRDFLTANPPDPDWQHDLEDLRRFVGPARTIDPWND